MKLSSKAKIAIAKVLCHPAVGLFVARLFRDRIPTNGCIVDTGSPIITAEIKAQLFWRFYESAELRSVKEHLRPDLDAIELGSSLGVVACHIRKRLHSHRRLVCVEASAELAELTKLNLRINGADNNVLVVNRAIDYGQSMYTKARFVPGESSLGGMVTHVLVEVDCPMIETATLSQIVNENAIGDYVLVSDIEGAEAGIALQDGDALRTCRQIIIELHNTRVNGSAKNIEQICEAFVEAHSFTLRHRFGSVFVFEK